MTGVQTCALPILELEEGVWRLGGCVEVEEGVWSLRRVCGGWEGVWRLGGCVELEEGVWRLGGCVEVEEGECLGCWCSFLTRTK